MWVHMFICKAAYLLIIGLQHMVKPGDLSQFAQFQLQTLQSSGQLFLLRWVQLLQGGKQKLRWTTPSML